jgi:hypothetical protein
MRRLQTVARRMRGRRRVTCGSPPVKPNPVRYITTYQNSDERPWERLTRVPCTPVIDHLGDECVSHFRPRRYMNHPPDWREAERLRKNMQGAMMALAFILFHPRMELPTEYSYTVVRQQKTLSRPAVEREGIVQRGLISCDRAVIDVACLRPHGRSFRTSSAPLK